MICIEDMVLDVKNSFVHFHLIGYLWKRSQKYFLFFSFKNRSPFLHWNEKNQWKSSKNSSKIAKNCFFFSYANMGRFWGLICVVKRFSKLAIEEIIAKNIQISGNLFENLLRRKCLRIFSLKNSGGFLLV